ncbi:HAD family hydrolase [Natronorubrum sp. DTA28]|uniref:HAD family hydrolase n=1 Tax=Natronorubrum sp. DTA28 TaxID=3447019 RepID=UPI003F86D25E
MTNAKAIFFDLDGTLLEHGQAYTEILTATFRTVEGEAREKWIERYIDAFYELFEACEPDPVRRAFASIDACSEPELLADELRRRETAACEPPDAVYEDLDRLSDGYRLGVLTNGFEGWQRHKLREHDLEQHFETVITSYQAGAHKPCEAPYRLAEARLPARAYAMVGDDDSDVDGATNAGWTACRYSGDGFADLPDILDWE